MTIQSDFHIFQRGRYTTNQPKFLSEKRPGPHWLFERIGAFSRWFGLLSQFETRYRLVKKVCVFFGVFKTKQIQVVIPSHNLWSVAFGWKSWLVVSWALVPGWLGVSMTYDGNPVVKQYKGITEGFEHSSYSFVWTLDHRFPPENGPKLASAMVCPLLRHAYDLSSDAIAVRGDCFCDTCSTSCSKCSFLGGFLLFS